MAENTTRLILTDDPSKNVTELKNEIRKQVVNWYFVGAVQARGVNRNDEVIVRHGADQQAEGLNPKRKF